MNYSAVFAEDIAKKIGRLSYRENITKKDQFTTAIDIIVDLRDPSKKKTTEILALTTTISHTMQYLILRSLLYYIYGRKRCDGNRECLKTKLGTFNNDLQYLRQRVNEIFFQKIANFETYNYGFLKLAKVFFSFDAETLWNSSVTGPSTEFDAKLKLYTGYDESNKNHHYKLFSKQNKNTTGSSASSSNSNSNSTNPLFFFLPCLICCAFD